MELIISVVIVCAVFSLVLFAILERLKPFTTALTGLLHNKMVSETDLIIEKERDIVVTFVEHLLYTSIPLCENEEQVIVKTKELFATNYPAIFSRSAAHGIRLDPIIKRGCVLMSEHIPHSHKHEPVVKKTGKDK